MKVKAHIRNGPLGYADTDYEYATFDNYPTEQEIQDFGRRAADGFTHIRWIKYFIENDGHWVDWDPMRVPPRTTDVE